MAGLQVLQKKYPLILKRSLQWKQVGLFLITQTVLFDLGCINVLKNLKCLDKLKSDSVSFTAKQLLPAQGPSSADSGAMHAAHRPLQPPAPQQLSPSRPETHRPGHSCCRHQAPGALGQGLSSRGRGARWTALHGLQRGPSRPASRDPDSIPGAGGQRQHPNGWRTTGIAPALESRPSPESVMRLR